MINIHVDVDNLWIYEQEFGVKILSNKEYIYSHSLPLFLKLLKKSRSKATFMVVGRDLLLPACQNFCKKAIREGHEIANHTWSHPIAFGTLSYKQKRQQILKCHQLIIKICGKAPVGFRGPGYYRDEKIIAILEKLNYQYDASVIPGFAQLLMGTYAKIRGENNRNKTFGRKEYIFSKETPYYVGNHISKKKILELPISILPILKLPLHTTFAYFYGSLYRQLILTYLKSNPKYFLYLFHAIDFIDLNKKYSNHPVIQLRYTLSERMQFINDVLDVLVEINGKSIQTSRHTTKALTAT